MSGNTEDPGGGLFNVAFTQQTLRYYAVVTTPSSILREARQMHGLLKASKKRCEEARRTKRRHRDTERS